MNQTVGVGSCDALKDVPCEKVALGSRRRVIVEQVGEAWTLDKLHDQGGHASHGDQIGYA